MTHLIEQTRANGKLVISWCATPTFTSHPVSININYGSNASFSVSTSTSNITSYQWQVNNGSGWLNTGTNSASLSLILPSVALSGNQYRCIITVNCGTFSISDPATLTVNQSTLMVTASNQSVQYSTPAASVTGNGTYTISGFINGDNSLVVNGLSSISYETTYTASTNAESSGIEITPNISGLSATNYKFSATSGSITITKADQFISSNFVPFSKPLNEFDTIPISATSSAGLPVEITIEIGSAAKLNEDPAFNYYLTEIGETGTVILYSNQSGNINYNPATPGIRTFDVTKSNQNISFPNIDDISYSNGLTLNLEAVASSGLDVTYTVESGPAAVSGSILTINGTGLINLTANQAGNASYNAAASFLNSFTVSKGSQTLSINVPSGNLTSSSLINGTSTSDLPVTLSLATGSDATSLTGTPGGNYTLSGIGSIGSGIIHIVGNQAGNSNFLVANQVIQTIDLTKSNQTITFNSIANQTYSPTLSVNLAANANSNLSVSFSVLSGPATLVGTTLDISGAGTVIVAASQSGNTIYNPAPSVTQQFEVLKATPDIVQSDLIKTFGDADFTISPMSASSGSYSFISGNDKIFTISGNTATVAGAGSTILNITQQPTANYNGTTKTIIFTVNKAVSSVVVTGATSYTYNGAQQGPDTSSGTGSTGDITYIYEGTGSTSYGPSSVKPVNAGSYFAIASVVEDHNYSGATSSPYNFSIVKANAVIIITPYSATYNRTEYRAVGAAAGISGDALLGLDLSETAHLNAGVYNNDPWSFTDVTGNYNNASGTVNNIINPKELIITALNQTKCFGEDFTFTGDEYHYTGLVAPETIETVSLTSEGSISGALADKYSIVASNATGGSFLPGNYDITYVEGEMTVKEEPTLTGASQSQTICEGRNATINLTGLKAERIFSLEYKINGIAQSQKTGLYSDVSGNSSFTVPNLFAANNGQVLQITQITITSELPNCSKSFSEEVILSVNPLPTLADVVQEAPACHGSSAKINISGLVAGSAFTVYYSINEVDQTPVTELNADETGSSFFFTSILSASNNGQILEITGLEIENATPVCYQGFDKSVTLNVEPASEAGTVSSSQFICNESTPEDITITGATGSIQWEVSTDNSNFTLIPDATLSTLSSAQMGSLTSTTYYRAQVTSGVCTPVYSAVVSVTANDLPVIFTLTGSSICTSAANTGTISLSNSQTGVSYQLKNASNTNVQEAQSGSTGTAINWTGLAAGNGYYVLATGNEPTYCTSQTNTVNITVIPNPTIYTLTGSTVCTNAPGTGTVTLSNSQTDVSYQLKNSSNANVQAAQSGNTGTAISWTNLEVGNGYYVVATGSLPTNCTNQTGPVNVTELPNPNPPTTTGAFICIGTPLGTQLSASGAGATEKYKWYDSSIGGTLLKTSTDYIDNTYTTPAISTTTSYWVSILSTGGCESTRTQVTATLPTVSTDSQTLAGSNYWIGHVYKRLDGTAHPPNEINAFSKYYGTSTNTEQFDENFTGNSTCFSLTASESPRSIYTEYYTVRYRMNSTTRKGIYVVNMGSDDGIRLTVDGTKVFDHWVQRGYNTDRNVLFQLTGNSNLLFEFYESAGGNRVSFQGLTRLIENKLTVNTSQSTCIGSAGTAISGDVYGTLPTGITLSGTGYQWAYSTNLEGPWINIPEATAATYTPNTASAPFNSVNTYYIIRKAILSSTNNISPNPYVATNESNVATVIVNPLPATSEIIPD